MVMSNVGHSSRSMESSIVSWPLDESVNQEPTLPGTHRVGNTDSSVYDRLLPSFDVAPKRATSWLPVSSLAVTAAVLVPLQLVFHSSLGVRLPLAQMYSPVQGD